MPEDEEEEDEEDEDEEDEEEVEEVEEVEEEEDTASPLEEGSLETTVFFRREGAAGT